MSELVFVITCFSFAALCPVSGSLFKRRKIHETSCRGDIGVLCARSVGRRYWRRGHYRRGGTTGGGVFDVEPEPAPQPASTATEMMKPELRYKNGRTRSPCWKRFRCSTIHKPIQHRRPLQLLFPIQCFYSLGLTSRCHLEGIDGLQDTPV